MIGARPARQCVGTCATGERVIPCSTLEDIVAAEVQAVDNDMVRSGEGELKLIAPAFVVVGKEDCPGCVPADLPVPREARSPASNTVVVRPPGDGTVIVGFGETAAILCLNGPSSASLGRAAKPSCSSSASGRISSQNINRGIMKRHHSPE